ncbi:MAG TPA: S1C family serine protease [Rhodoblastus sp.]|nr:S1C family serine protease [Rhodoblastus sp.]
MAERLPTIPRELQPKQKNLSFDLDRALAGVVSVKALAPEDAYTARSLGTERMGHGVVIRQSGLVLTVGYLIIEAQEIWLRTIDGRVIAGHALAYDQETGFGLVQAMSSLDLPVLPIGASGEVAPGDSLIIAGSGGREATLSAYCVGRQQFAGYWEYWISDAIMTAPAHPFWGGAAVIDELGRLAGVASLQVEAGDGKATQSLNMAIPINLLPPTLDDLVKYGRPNKPPRPWLGIYATEIGERIVIAGVADDGPAEQAGVEMGDMLVAVAGEKPASLGEVWRRVWAQGPAGVEIPLLVERQDRVLEIRVKSADRLLFTRARVIH